MSRLKRLILEIQRRKPPACDARIFDSANAEYCLLSCSY
jgi:hypothetical protein